MILLLILVSVFQVVHNANEEAGFEMEHKIWSICNSTTGYCTCGKDIEGILKCSSEELSIATCYCVSQDKNNFFIVGTCMYTCFLFHAGSSSYVINRSAVMFYERMCEVYKEPLHREGRFCGQCKEGYGLAAYSYHYISCVPCRHYGYKNYVRYVTVAFLPLTIFYFLVVTLRINVLSSSLTCFVLVVQCLLSPQQLYLLDAWEHSGLVLHRKTSTFLLNLFSSIFGVVNLDFFRFLYPYFCLHPKLNILHILSLEYLIALYPFLLIFITYLLVTLYDRNYRVVVWAWRPFKWCLRRYQKEFIVKSSLVETFATFILLSSVKILDISFFLLAPTRLYNEMDAKPNKLFLYLDANMEFFGHEHLPFAVLALLTGFIFYFLPLLLLAFYPCRCFQKCLNVLGWRCQVVHVLMDAFQGSYKTKPHDLRSFSAFLFFLRCPILLTQLTILSPFYLPVYAFITISATLIFAIFQPYKNSSHNKQDLVIMLSAALVFVGFTADTFSYLDFVNWLSTANVILIGSILLIAGIGFTLLFKIIVSKFRRLRLFLNRSKQDVDDMNTIETFDREDTVDSVQYPPLLSSHNR